MKRNYTVSLLIIILVIGSLVSCNNKGSDTTNVHQHDKVSQEYTCPMHPQIVQDKPGSCPICGMDLVPRKTNASHISIDTSLSYLLKPVNEQIVATIPVIKPRQGSKIYTAEVHGRITYDTRNQTSISSRVSGRIERLYIKYNYQPVKKGQLIMEIYSPDLATAQRELLYISRTGNEESMLQLAKQRLLLLGMNTQQVSKVLKTGKIIYSVPIFSNTTGYILEKSAASSIATLPSSNTSAGTSSGGMDNMGGNGSANSAASITPGPSPVLMREGQYVGAGQSIFTIYQTNILIAEFSLNPQVAARINKNEKVIIQRTANKEDTFTGTIGLIQPVFNEGENFTQARVYFKNKDLKVGELVIGRIPFMTSRGSWVPKEAILSLGNQAVIFKKEGQVFVPKGVRIGVSAENEVQVLEDISNWNIASNAYYLVDSESFIKVHNTEQ